MHCECSAQKPSGLPCKIFSSCCDVVARCGGCPWLALDAAAEQSHKTGLVHALAAQLSGPAADVAFVAAPSRVGYRNRIRLRIDDQGQIGFFNSEKSATCVALMPELRTFMTRLQQVAAPYKSSLTSFAHLEARAPDAFGRAGLYLWQDAAKRADPGWLAQLRRALAPAHVSTNRDATVATQQFSIDEHTDALVPLNGFMQINSQVNQLLVQQVVTSALDGNWQSFVNLFGGSGNFALPLAQRGLPGTLVELNRDCVRAAADAASRQRLDRLEFFEGDAMAVAASLSASQRPFDAVIVDPPRAGIRQGLDVIAALARREIVYCSCNPASLARDLHVLAAKGWHPRRLVGFDMFPGTAHVETVAWLGRDIRSL